jgi:prohibitin 2
VTTANGTARPIEFINNAIEHSPHYLQYLALQKWNGKLPQVLAGEHGEIPFITIPNGYQNDIP